MIPANIALAVIGLKCAPIVPLVNTVNYEKDGMMNVDKTVSIGAKSDYHEPAVLDFIAVVQCDYSEQMDVFRWILNDTSYACIWIRHDKDTFTQEDISERATDNANYITRKNGDGSESQFKAGDIKPAHIHMIVRVRKKMRASTLSKRFCGQVHFEATAQKYGDTFEACRYLTHESFRARSKYQYSRDCVQFSGASFCEARGYYNDLMRQDGDNLLSDLQHFIQYKDNSSEFTSIADRALTSSAIATRLAVQCGDITLVKRIMSHSYFFDHLL